LAQVEVDPWLEFLELGQAVLTRRVETLVMIGLAFKGDFHRPTKEL